VLPEGKARGRKPPPNGGVARPGRHRRGRHAGVGREREARRLEGARASGRGEENKERGRKKREEKGKKKEKEMARDSNRGCGRATRVVRAREGRGGAGGALKPADP